MDTLRKSVIIFALLAVAQVGMAQDYSLRTLATCDGAAQPKCGGALEFIRHQQPFDLVSVLTSRYLADGMFHQTISAGVERVVLQTSLADVFACADAGVELTEGSQGGLVGGCFGFVSKPLLTRDAFTLRVAAKGRGSNATLQGGDWSGSFAAGLQLDFREK